MATPWTPTQRLAAYKAAGITKIVEMSGWRTHGRDDETGKTFGPVHGVLIHHTAGVGSGMADFCRRGTPALPGPLCHDFLSKGGTLYLVGHGRTNHAGTTTQAVREAIIDERAPQSHQRSGTETVDANDFLFGLEIENWGNGGDPYPAAQYATAVKWAAAHARYYDWGPYSVWGHKEITTRKIDPSFDMDKFRDDVASLLTAWDEPAPVPKPPVEADMTRPEFTHLTRTTPLTLIPGAPAYVSWAVESADEPGDHGTGGHTFLSGNRQYSGVLSLYLDGLPAWDHEDQAHVQVRTTLLRAGYPDSDGPTVDVYGQTDGTARTRIAIPIVGRTGTGQSLAIEIINEHTSVITLAWAGVTVESWAV